MRTDKVDVKINHFEKKSAGQQDSIGKQHARKVMLFWTDTCQPHIKTCKGDSRVGVLFMKRLFEPNLCLHLFITPIFGSDKSFQF